MFLNDAEREQLRAQQGYYRADLVVNDEVIVEIKSTAGISGIHEAQLMSYLKLSDCKYGLLINFNVKLLREGIRRFKI